MKNRVLPKLTFAFWMAIVVFTVVNTIYWVAWYYGHFEFVQGLALQYLWFTNLVYIPVCLVLLTVIILVITRKRIVWSLVVVGVNVFILVNGLLAFSAVLNLNGNRQDEMHILPDHFQGAVTIVYDPTFGREVEMRNDTIVYRIPEDGVLFTKDSLAPRIGSVNYYYQNKRGQLREIPYRYDRNSAWGDSVEMVLGSGIGRRTIMPNGPLTNATILYESYVVSTKENLDQIGEEADKLDVLALAIKWRKRVADSVLSKSN